MAIDVYERITARILTQLEKGTIPWRKPWKGGEAGHPRNLVSGHRYRGVNIFLLTCAPFDLPFWLTFRQAKQLGGHVRKGEESTPVVFWRWVEREHPETGNVEKFPVLRHYNAFNIEQCDLPAEKVPEIATVPENDFEPIQLCEDVVAGMPDPPSIQHGGGRASYRPATDSVQMPRPERFDGPEEYYSTLFHELTHSTGHPSRLDRPGITEIKPFGTPDYSREELVAEMGAAFLCGHCGIENTVIENSAAYIAGWLQRLRNDKRLVIQAAAAAQKAAD
ncbi:MAG: DUF1738 domain-containing protein, partial [Planctomycetaceae bacterium]|nr:DUF1738 domain-containing protein [Planctomycetaceae bacterium]